MDSAGSLIVISIMVLFVLITDAAFSSLANLFYLIVTTLSLVMPLVMIVLLIPHAILKNKKEYGEKRNTESQKRLRNSIIIVCLLILFESFQFIKTTSFRKELAGNKYLGKRMTDFGTVFATEHEYTYVTLDFDNNNKCSIYRLVVIGSLDRKDLPGELTGVFNYHLLRTITGKYILFTDQKHIYKFNAEKNVPEEFFFITMP